MRDYLSVSEVLAIHDNLIDRYGGTRGVRDFEALTAVVNRTQTVYHDDLGTEAMALWLGLTDQDLFVDGTKRTAFAAMHTFLRINGAKLTVSRDDSYKFILELYQSRGVSARQLAERLRSRIEEPSARRQRN